MATQTSFFSEPIDRPHIIEHTQPETFKYNQPNKMNIMHNYEYLTHKFTWCDALRNYRHVNRYRNIL